MFRGFSFGRRKTHQRKTSSLCSEINKNSFALTHSIMKKLSNKKLSSRIFINNISFWVDGGELAVGKVINREQSERNYFSDTIPPNNPYTIFITTHF